MAQRAKQRKWPANADRVYALTKQAARAWLHRSSVPTEERDDFAEEVALACASAAEQCPMWAELGDLDEVTCRHERIWGYVDRACGRLAWRGTFDRFVASPVEQSTADEGEMSQHERKRRQQAQQRRTVMSDIAQQNQKKQAADSDVAAGVREADLHEMICRTLTGRVADVFRLVALEEMSHRDTAEILGISVDASYQALRRARILLRAVVNVQT